MIAMQQNEEFNPKIKGGAHVRDCAEKCRQAAECFRNFAKAYPKETWAYPGTREKGNCHTFQEQGMEKCNLEE